MELFLFFFLLKVGLSVWLVLVYLICFFGLGLWWWDDRWRGGGGGGVNGVVSLLLGCCMGGEIEVV